MLKSLAVSKDKSEPIQKTIDKLISIYGLISEQTEPFYPEGPEN